MREHNDTLLPLGGTKFASYVPSRLSTTLTCARRVELDLITLTRANRYTHGHVRVVVNVFEFGGDRIAAKSLLHAIVVVRLDLGNRSQVRRALADRDRAQRRKRFARSDRAEVVHRFLYLFDRAVVQMFVADKAVLARLQQAAHRVDLDALRNA